MTPSRADISRMIRIESSNAVEELDESLIEKIENLMDPKFEEKLCQLTKEVKQLKPESLEEEGDWNTEGWSSRSQHYSFQWQEPLEQTQSNNHESTNHTAWAWECNIWTFNFSARIVSGEHRRKIPESMSFTQRIPSWKCATSKDTENCWLQSKR